MTENCLKDYLICEIADFVPELRALVAGCAGPTRAWLAVHHLLEGLTLPPVLGRLGLQGGDLLSHQRHLGIVFHLDRVHLRLVVLFNRGELLLGLRKASSREINYASC